MPNLLLEPVEYKVEKTRYGQWRRYLNPNGQYFAEFKSYRTLFGLPLVHYTRGICPETGRRIRARGVIAVGRVASGIIAIGQASFGLLAIGQLAVGVLFGLGQASFGALAIGQLAVGIILGLGQFATGIIAIGQFVLGKYVLAQAGLGAHVWSQSHAAPEAVVFFRELAEKIVSWSGYFRTP